MSVGILFDSFSNNVGDIAMFEANRQLLERHGIHDVSSVDLFGSTVQEYSSLVVGGGELIRPTGDMFYDRFRQVQGTVLAAVGVWNDSDSLDYLNNYSWVTARTKAETHTLIDAGLDGHVMPCPTMCLPIDDRSVSLPDDETLVGVHIVPATLRDVPTVMEQVSAMEGRKVLIPFTRYLDDRSFLSALPVGDATNLMLDDDLTPVQLRGVVSRLSFVVASSLHLSLWAISAGIPFVSYAQPKVEAYLKDRGLGALLFKDDESLERALQAAPLMVDTIRTISAEDKERVDDEYASIARILTERQGEVIAVPPLSTEPYVDQLTLLKEQVRAVISGRDVLLNSLINTGTTPVVFANALRAQRNLTIQLDEASKEIDWYKDEASIARRVLWDLRTQLKKRIHR